MPPRSVYPCVYWEHSWTIHVVYWASGLSLCIQGTLFIRPNPRALGRFIPVYTGNTRAFPSVPCHQSVYPCVYREHIMNPSSSIENAGLSLCVQGTPSFRAVISLNGRFIPVCTGNTNLKNSSGSFFTVYPCVYREHIGSSRLRTGKNGLSLCVQGTQASALSQPAYRRFIPVCTGNTILGETTRNH